MNFGHFLRSWFELILQPTLLWRIQPTLSLSHHLSYFKTNSTELKHITLKHFNLVQFWFEFSYFILYFIDFDHFWSLLILITHN